MKQRINLFGPRFRAEQIPDKEAQAAPTAAVNSRDSHFRSS